MSERWPADALVRALRGRTVIDASCDAQGNSDVRLVLDELAAPDGDRESSTQPKVQRSGGLVDGDRVEGDHGQEGSAFQPAPLPCPGPTGATSGSRSARWKCEPKRIATVAPKPIGGSSRLPAVSGLGRASSTGRRPSASGWATASRPPPSSTRRPTSSSRSSWPARRWLVKRVMDVAAKPARAATLEQEVTIQELCARSADFAEGTAAFAEKRRPEFSGR